jgi:hypothetical protein
MNEAVVFRASDRKNIALTKRFHRSSQIAPELREKAQKLSSSAMLD